MPNDPQKIIALFTSIATFGLVLSLWLMGVTLWLSRRKRRQADVRQRLQFVDGVTPTTPTKILRLWHEGRQATTIVPVFGNTGFIQRLERVRINAGWESPLSAALVGFVAAMLMVGSITYLLTNSLVVSIMSIFGAIVVFWLYLSQRISKRTAVFERQLVDALSLAARSLRIGHPLVGSFRLIAEEIPDPVGKLFAEVVQQQQLGVSMDQALRSLANDSTHDDLRLFATSVVIQIASGGNLADMMERLANVIRERQRLARRVKVLTAQTQFSKRVLLSLPFLIFVILNVINPNYMRPLYSTPTGQLIMLLASAGLFLGWLTMNWLSRLSF